MDGTHVPIENIFFLTKLPLPNFNSQTRKKHAETQFPTLLLDQFSISDIQKMRAKNAQLSLLLKSSRVDRQRWQNSKPRVEIQKVCHVPRFSRPSTALLRVSLSACKPLKQGLSNGKIKKMKKRSSFWPPRPNWPRKCRILDFKSAK